MKSYRYKIVSAFVALAIAILGVYGCSGKVVKQTPKPNISKNNSQFPDLKGETIKVLYWKVKPGDGAAPYANFGYEGQKMTERINRIQRDYNCKIQYVGDGTPHVPWGKLHSSIMMGEPTADIAFVGLEHVIQSFEKGGLYTVLNDYAKELEIDNADLWDQTVTKGLNTIEGMTVSLQPAFTRGELVNWCSVMYFNKSMLERESLWDEYNIYDLQKNKTWTWDKLDEIGRKITKDTDGDGIIDQYGMIYNPHAYNGFNGSNVGPGNDAGFFNISENNQALFAGRDKEQLNMLTFLKESGAKGNGWLKSKNVSYEDTEKYFAEGNAAFIVDLGGEIKTFKSLKMKDTLGVVAVPMGPDNKNKDYTISREWFQEWVIPNGLKKPMNSVYVMRELCAPLYTNEESEIATETALSEVVGNESEIIETYNMLGDVSRVANISETPFVALWTPAIESYHGSFHSIIEDGMTPAGLNDQWGDAVQEDMNKYWKLVAEGVKKMKDARTKAGK